MGKRKRVIEYTDSDSEESSDSSSSTEKLDPNDWYVPTSDDDGGTADKSEENYRIPRKSDYTSATNEVPSPPQVSCLLLICSLKNPRKGVMIFSTYCLKSKCLLFSLWSLLNVCASV